MQENVQKVLRRLQYINKSAVNIAHRQIHEMVDQLFIERCDNFKMFGELLNCFPRLYSIYAVNNSLINISGILSLKETLVHINLSYNYIKNPELVYECTQIRYLNLSHNQIRFFTPYNNVLERSKDYQSSPKQYGLSELVYLNLCNNKLHTIDVSNSKKLQFLDVQNNLLQDFEINNRLENIIYLNVQANGLRDVKQFFKFNKITSLRFLFLANNLFNDYSDKIEQQFIDNGFDLSKTELCLQFIPSESDMAGHLVSKEIGLYDYEPDNQLMNNTQYQLGIQAENVDAPEVNVEDVLIPEIYSYDDEVATTISQVDIDENPNCVTQTVVQLPFEEKQSTLQPFISNPQKSLNSLENLNSSKNSKILDSSSFLSINDTSSVIRNNNVLIDQSSINYNDQSNEIQNNNVHSNQQNYIIGSNFIRYQQLNDLELKYKWQLEVNKKQNDTIQQLRNEISNLQRNENEKKQKTSAVEVQKLKDEVKHYKAKFIQIQRDLFDQNITREQQQIENECNRLDASTQCRVSQLTSVSTQTDDSFIRESERLIYIENLQKTEQETQKYKEKREKLQRLTALISSVEADMFDVQNATNDDLDKQPQKSLENLLKSKFSDRNITQNDESADTLDDGATKEVPGDFSELFNTKNFTENEGLTISCLQTASVL